MNKSLLIKIVGIILISFLVITVAMFFLYPYINEDNYEKIQAERLENSASEPTGNRVQTGEESNLTGGGQFTYLQNEIRRLRQGDFGWEEEIDSLKEANRLITMERDSVLAELQDLKERLENEPERFAENVGQAAGNPEMVAASDEATEEFSERVKSLLNLDEEELEPIANQMTQNELVKIFKNSSNMQREKLLRSLSPERAAKLMREIML